MLVLLTLLIAILTRKEMNWLLEIFNFDIGKYNLLLRTFIYSILLTLCLAMYDFLVMKFGPRISMLLDKGGQALVKKEKVKHVLWVVRIGYSWEMIYRFLRLNWFSYTLTDNNGVWAVLSKASISQNLVSLSKILLSLPVIFSFILACFSLNILSFTEIQEWIISSLNFKINFSDIFSQSIAVFSLSDFIFIVFISLYVFLQHIVPFVTLSFKKTPYVDNHCFLSYNESVTKTSPVLVKIPIERRKGYE